MRKKQGQGTLACFQPVRAAGWILFHPRLCASWPSGIDVNAPLRMSGSADLTRGRLEGLGVHCFQAVQARLHSPLTPLQLAVSCGHAAAAAALLQAGAHTDGSFNELLPFARWQAAALGQAAGAQLPPLVQRLAGLLCSADMSSAAVVEAHRAAAHLAFPHHPYVYSGTARLPPCPWLLEHLLQLHRAGAIPGAATELAAAIAPVCAAICSKPPPPAEQQPWGPAAPQGRAARDALLAGWLRLPAAASMPAHVLTRTFRDACERGLTNAALPALLALAPVQALLRAEAEEPLAFGAVSFVPVGAVPTPLVLAAPLVRAAAGTRRAAVLDAVLAAGGAITLNTVRSAVHHAARDHCWELHHTDECVNEAGLRALKLLLSRGRPRVQRMCEPDLPQGTADYPTYTACPIYAALHAFHCHLESVSGRL